MGKTFKIHIDTFDGYDTKGILLFIAGRSTVTIGCIRRGCNTVHYAGLQLYKGSSLKDAEKFARKAFQTPDALIEAVEDRVQEIKSFISKKYKGGE